MMEIDIDGYGTMTGPHSFAIMANKRILELIQGQYGSAFEASAIDTNLSTLFIPNR